MTSFYSKNTKETQKIGKYIAKMLKNGDVLLFYGDLGAGKTTLIKGIINALKIKEIVVSPTFTIVKNYKHKDVVVNHFDLYRIESVDELSQIGFEEMLKNGINFIEWPQIGKQFYSQNSIKIEIKKLGESEREFVLNGGSF